MELPEKEHRSQTKIDSSSSISQRKEKVESEKNNYSQNEIELKNIACEVTTGIANILTSQQCVQDDSANVEEAYSNLENSDLNIVINENSLNGIKEVENQTETNASAAGCASTQNQNIGGVYNSESIDQIHDKHGRDTLILHEELENQTETVPLAPESNLPTQLPDTRKFDHSNSECTDIRTEQQSHDLSVINYEVKRQSKSDAPVSILSTSLSLERNIETIPVEDKEQNHPDTTKSSSSLQNTEEENVDLYVVEVIQSNAESKDLNTEESTINDDSLSKSVTKASTSSVNDDLDTDLSLNEKQKETVPVEQGHINKAEHNNADAIKHITGEKYIVENSIIGRSPLSDDDQSKTNTSVSIVGTSLTHRKRPSTFISPEAHKRPKVGLYAEDVGPKIFSIKGNVITDPIILKNLPEMYNFLPIFGKPTTTLQDFHNQKIREFVGCDLNDKEFEKLSDYCSPGHLKTGREPVLSLSQRCQLPGTIDDENNMERSSSDEEELMILKKLSKKDAPRLTAHKDYTAINGWKYRGLRILPLPTEKDFENADLEPGKDLLIRARLYRPFLSNFRNKSLRQTRSCVFSCDLVLTGKNTLIDLRDRFSCPNDISMRVDVSNNPYGPPPETVAKDLFPSSFLFVNNIFYSDCRPGCKDLTKVIRDWAASRGLGDFPCRDMNTRLEDIDIRLGHPDVFVHQGNCEHVFAFSEIRLLNSSDPLKLSSYPTHTKLSLNQTMYCTTCAEFAAKWVVVGCERVPFDPAYFCEPCYKLYLYKDGKKIGDFKAYKFKANELGVKAIGSTVTE